MPHFLIHHTCTRKSPLVLTILLCCTSLQAQHAPAEIQPQSESDLEATHTEQLVDELVVSAQRVAQENPDDPFGLLTSTPTDLVFGLTRSLQATPRSLASIDETAIDLYDIESTDDFVAFAAGMQNASFFGIAASPDIRGSLADVYFRGVRRLVNASGWVTLVGATSRVDLVRGPASPIHGPGAIAGYLNFVPKTARAENGRFLSSPTGALSITTGAWNRRQLEAEAGGPVNLAGSPGGFHLFAYWEDRERYYEYLPNNTQRMLQGSLVVDVTDTLWFETGFQYQKWGGSEAAGWNRITQELIDSGTYLAGAPLVNLDTDGDGAIGQREVTALSPDNRLNIFTPYGSGVGLFDNEQERQALRLDPSTVRLVQIGTDDCLCSPSDDGAAESLALYLDAFMQVGSHLEVTQKLFFDYGDRHILSSYGFSQAHNSRLLEERVEFRWKARSLGPVGLSLVVSPSIRYYHTRALQDFGFEYFDRRDISRPPSPLDVRHASLSDPIAYPYNRNVETEALNAALAQLADISLGRFSLLLGWRWDNYDVTSENAPTAYGSREPGVKVSNRQSETAWNASLSAELGRFRPYVTIARQPVILGGQSGEINTRNVRTNPLNVSALEELGIKYQDASGRLFASLSRYQQRRRQYSDQTGENLALYGEGTELEVRALVGKRVGVFMTATNARVERRPLTSKFIFASPALTGFAPEDQYGGAVTTVLPANDSRFRDRGGIPESVYSGGISYSFDWGLIANMVATRVSHTYSGVGRSVKLPAYTLLNLSATYERGPWIWRLSIRNALDERYFQSAFPHIFGDVMVVPRLPRYWQLSLTRNFGAE